MEMSHFKDQERGEEMLLEGGDEEMLLEVR
jgi:hypothetical protein